MDVPFIPTAVEGDRRRHVRVAMARPCKIHDPRSGKYLAATTQDISGGGLLVELPRVLEIKPGETLHVGVAMKRRQPLLHSNQMLAARVTRSMLTADDRTLIGLKFEQPQAEQPQVEHDVSQLRLAA